MPFDWWTLALQAINVLVLVWILGRFFFRPVAAIVAKRREETERLMAEAEAKRQQAERERAAAEAARTEVAEERERLMAEAQKAAEAEKARLLSQPAEDLARQREEAEHSLARQREEAEGELINHASDLSVEIARRLLGRLPADATFAAFLAGIEKALQDLQAEDGAAGFVGADGDHPLEVVTAAPLDADQAAQVREMLQRVGGSDVQVTFRTDPDLIAGIEVHARNTTIRNNWQADLARIREELAHDRNHLPS